MWCCTEPWWLNSWIEGGQALAMVKYRQITYRYRSPLSNRWSFSENWIPKSHTASVLCSPRFETWRNKTTVEEILGCRDDFRGYTRIHIWNTISLVLMSASDVHAILDVFVPRQNTRRSNNAQQRLNSRKNMYHRSRNRLFVATNCLLSKTIKTTRPAGWTLHFIRYCPFSLVFSDTVNIFKNLRWIREELLQRISNGVNCKRDASFPCKLQTETAVVRHLRDRKPCARSFWKSPFQPPRSKNSWSVLASCHTEFESNIWRLNIQTCIHYLYNYIISIYLSIYLSISLYIYIYNAFICIFDIFPLSWIRV